MVVRAVQVEAGGVENAVAMQDDFAVFDAVRQGRRVAVVDDVLSLFGGGDAVFVVAIDDGDARLAHEVGFGGGVGGEVVVAVEVVGGDVEDGGDARVERGAEFELVAGEFEDVAVGRFAVKEGIQHGAADVAAEFGALSCMVEGGGKQGDDGAFAVAAGHGQHGFVVQEGEEFDVVDLSRVVVGEGGAAAVHAGADDEGGGAGEGVRVVEVAFFDAAFV